MSSAPALKGSRVLLTPTFISTDLRQGGKPPTITGGVIIIIDDDDDDSNHEAEVRRQAGMNRRQVKKVKYHQQAAPSRRSKRVKNVERVDGEFSASPILSTLTAQH